MNKTISVYLTEENVQKLHELKIAFMKKDIYKSPSYNQIIRLLIDKAKIEDVV